MIDLTWVVRIVVCAALSACAVTLGLAFVTDAPKLALALVGSIMFSIGLYLGAFGRS